MGKFNRVLIFAVLCCQLPMIFSATITVMTPSFGGPKWVSAKIEYDGKTKTVLQLKSLIQDKMVPSNDTRTIVFTNVSIKDNAPIKELEKQLTPYNPGNPLSRSLSPLEFKLVDTGKPADYTDTTPAGLTETLEDWYSGGK